MNIVQNMQLFSELIRCGGEIYTWCYEADGSLVKSSCPDAALVDSAFELFGCKQQMLEHGREHHRPITLGSAMGIQWAAAFTREDEKLMHCWVIGPVFYRDVSLNAIVQGMKYYGNLENSVAWTIQFYDIVKKIPVLQNTIMARYTLMLHYCITGEQLNMSDLNIKTVPLAAGETKQNAEHDRHRVWRAEQALLEMVRTGDLNYSRALSESVSISAGVPVQSDDALRQAKTSLIVFTSIVCRAAIEGGLSPEAAYSLGDEYIQTVESARTTSSLMPLASMMYDDFVQRVHRARTNPKLSRQIQQCIDYIELHLDMKISAAELAKQAGYTEYYLTHKFKEETGMSVSDYCRQVKIKRARLLLRSTDLTVQEIAMQLGFGTRNYFSRVFMQVTGMTPAEFRSRT